MGREPLDRGYPRPALPLPDAPHAEAIRERLEISHGNCSTSLRELLAWGVIRRVHRRVHRRGERKARYESEQDPWTWFTQTIRERRRREVLPVMQALHEVREFARSELKGSRGDARKQLAETSKRIDRFTDFVDEFVELIDAFLAVGSGRMGKVLRQVARLAAPRRQRR